MLRGIKQLDQDHTDSVSEPELKSKFFWLQRYLSGWKKYFPGEIPHRYNCWSLSPINFRFIAWENYFWKCASRSYDFCTYRVHVNIQFIPGEVKRDWLWDACTREGWLTNGESSHSTALLGELFMENGSFNTISTTTLSKEKPATLAKILLVSCTHRTRWSNIRNWICA